MLLANSWSKEYLFMDGYSTKHRSLIQTGHSGHKHKNIHYNRKIKNKSHKRNQICDHNIISTLEFLCSTTEAHHCNPRENVKNEQTNKKKPEVFF